MVVVQVPLRKLGFQTHVATGENSGLEGRGRNVYPVMGDLST